MWGWQQRFAEQGGDGLSRDKTRNPGDMPLPPVTIASVLPLPCGETSTAVTDWTGRAVAYAVGVSLSAVQCIWQAHRLRTFKASNDPAFAAKVEDIFSVYMNQPSLPLKPGRCGTITHDYKRYGATMLFAALDILDASAVRRCMPRHTDQDLIKSLGTVVRVAPAGKLIHAIADNYANNKQPKVSERLANHARWVFHFTPTSASLINAVGIFFFVITRHYIRRCVSASVADIQDAISSYICQYNQSPKPFVCAKPPDVILAKLGRQLAASD